MVKKDALKAEVKEAIIGQLEGMGTFEFDDAVRDHLNDTMDANDYTDGVWDAMMDDASDLIDEVIEEIIKSAK